jgi:hypothetical protein
MIMGTAERKQLIVLVFAAVIGALLLLLGNLAGWINTGNRGEMPVTRLDSFVRTGVLPGVDSVTNLFYDIDHPTTIDV